MDFPRHVHKADGLWLSVTDEDAFDQALREGWCPHPPIDLVNVDGELRTVTTREELDALLDAGWASVEPDPAA